MELFCCVLACDDQTTRTAMEELLVTPSKVPFAKRSIASFD